MTIIAKVALTKSEAVTTAYIEYMEAKLRLQRALSEECVQVEESTASGN